MASNGHGGKRKNAGRKSPENFHGRYFLRRLFTRKQIRALFGQKFRTEATHWSEPAIHSWYREDLA
jgi:hypothetical protein